MLNLLHHRPFEPFRLYLSDGVVFDVRHPELAMVGRSTVLVRVPAAGSSEPLLYRFVNCSLMHITRAEPIDESTRAYNMRSAWGGFRLSIG